MQINIHLVSDSTGEVLGSLSRFLGSIFNNTVIKEYFWYLTKTKRQIDDIMSTINEIKNNNNSFHNIVISSFSDGNIELYVTEKCRDYKVPFKSSTKSIVNFLQQFCQESPTNQTSDIHTEFGQNYFQRIDAIEYTIAHDDGNLANDLDDADILLIGPSRTSKTPVSVYLAYRGFKVANIPFVDESHFDVSYLKSLTKTLIIGLTINPDRLENIRKTRLQHIGADSTQTKYVDIQEIGDVYKRQGDRR